MRAIKAIIALLFVVCGIFLGALNQQVVEIDWFFAHYQAPLGLSLILSLLIGTILGGALSSVSWFLRSKKDPIAKNTTNKANQTQSDSKA
jgi:uncharacterized integral membrane protein